MRRLPELMLYAFFENLRTPLFFHHISRRRFNFETDNYGHPMVMAIDLTMELQIQGTGNHGFKAF
jgi:hypothetical protein